MRLKKLDLYGFKSFADPTEFEFEPGVTAIVGPNGCGKSNVVDAVKWILGEQSARSLRGKEMMDVIFNGSGSRKSLGFSEASLTFLDLAMEDGTILPEVVITRRLYRSGVSEYMINREGCRLRDIRELFLDTGVGVQAYSIIEQGRIDAILTRSPADRRVIFEEAAGISRYKRKRIEAERKLERTEANLLRINDRMGEVERRLRSLKAQATRARRYREMDIRLRELRVRYSLYTYDRHHGVIDQHAAERRLRETEVERLRGQLEEREAGIRELEERVVEIDRQLEDLAGAKNEVELKITEATGDITHGQRLIDEIEGATEAERREIADQEERLTADRAQLDETRGELERMRAQQAQATAAVERARGEEQALAATLAEEQEQIAAVRRARGEFQESREELRRQVTRQEALLKGRQEHETRLREERSRITTDLEGLRSDREEQDREVHRLAEVIGKMTDYYHRQEEVTRSAEEELEGRSQALAAASEEYHAAVSRREVLQGLLERRTRRGGGQQVLGALDQGAPATAGVCGLVADLIETDPAHYATVEAALGTRAEAVICRDREGATRLLGSLGGSGAPRTETLVAAELDPGARGREATLRRALDEPGTAGRLLDQVAVSDAPRLDGAVAREGAFTDGVDGRFRVGSDGRFQVARPLTPFQHERLGTAVVDHLLGDVVLVDQLPRASQLARRYPELRFVTAAGQLAGGPRLTTGGTTQGEPAVPGEGGPIARRNELRRLVERVAELRSTLDKRTAEREAGARHLAGLETELQRLRGEIYDANIERTEKRSARRHLEQALTTARESLGSVEQQLGQLAGQRTRLQERLGVLARETAIVDQEIAAAGERITYLEGELTRRRARRSELRDQMRQLELTRARAGEQITATARVIEGLEGAVQERRERIGRQEAALASSRRRIAAVRTRMDEAEARRQRLAQEREQLEQRLTEVSRRREGVRADIDRRRQELRGEREELETVEAAIQELRLKEHEAQVQAQALADRVLDEYELDLPGMFERLQRARAIRAEARPGVAVPPPEGEELHGPPAEFDWLLLGEVDWSQVDTEISELRRRMGNLGNVNLDAIDECQAEQERHQEMVVQRDDLAKAKQQLEQLIENLNTRSRELFLETLTSVRENFKVLFRKLFGGGNADILLEEGDPLEAGIEIMAKPPGKEPTSISLLSGGEKSMTAVALLFAIFRSRPSPFCILDEVDAALDEANITRFVGLLREFLEDSQFIIITHNKRTMSVADAIHGVTMQESGVSKRISVKFEEVA